MRPAGLAAIIALAVLCLAQVAHTDPTPLVKLSRVTVVNGTAVLSGNVGGGGSEQHLTVNGQPLKLDASGYFDGTVDLKGAAVLVLSLSSPGGDETNSFEIPLTGGMLAPNGVIPSGVLDSIDQAGLSVLAPVSGGKDKPLEVGGHVLNPGDLAGLTVNGKDVLGQLSSDHAFSLQVPETTKVITVTATDKQGVSETKTILARSLVWTPYGMSIASSEALGIRITQVRTYVKGVAKTHRLRTVVTVKDRRGYLVRGATIAIRGTKVSSRLFNAPKAKKSSRIGTASFIFSVRTRALGRRLTLVVNAKTQSAKAARTAVVRLPKNVRKAAHH